ncbi:MAG: DUF4197 domain-containing protein [Flavobacterium sp.]
MKKYIVTAFVALFFVNCAEMQQIANQLPQNFPMNQADIASGLKEALQNGIDKQVTKLTATDGFYRNELVKIMLPEELKKVDSRLRSLGLSSLADEGLLMINRAAENAVKEATPIFIDAIKQMSINDAQSILMGQDNAATSFLQKTTNQSLYNKFKPIIASSYQKVGADKVWNSIISKYNTIPLVEKVNPDLTDYTTKKAMDGVFTMIAIEEKNIRNTVSARSSELLRKVFAMQD